jgi:plastocyanin domain-containing protein
MKNKTIIIAVFAAVMAIFISSANAQRTTKANKLSTKRIQSVRINLTDRGYQPSSFRLKKGVPARITFVRKTEDECGKEIVIPAYKIRRELPLNTPVTVNFTPRKAGSFGFACGMDMLRGKVIVQ